jgi:prepilin-type N-terminal cleavage/methylation domain-containing protein
MKHSGFSLVELMISVAIFAVVMLLMSGIIVNGLKVRQSNGLDIRAQVYASTYLQKIKNHWLDSNKYNTGDIQILSAPDGYKEPNLSISCINLDGSIIATTNALTCDGTSPPIRRIGIDVYDTQNKLRAHLITEIGNPNP